MTTLARLQDHLQNGVRERAHGPVPCVHCADGLELSVQAGLFYSSTPKAETGPWTHVECNSDPDLHPDVLPYEERLDASSLYDGFSLYHRVPIEVIAKVIDEHGGLV
jgi:hypothetical protein